MFLAELDNLLLTTGHDLDKIQFPLKVDFADGSESFNGIGGREQNLTKNDLFLSDKSNILSSILNGPDNNTAITKDIMYFVYGVDGISSDIIQNHLNDIKQYILIDFPDSKIDSIYIS